jgi:simple sugar transport system permease protein
LRIGSLAEIRFERRRKSLGRKGILITISAVLIGILLAGLFFSLIGVSPVFAYKRILIGSFGSMSGWREILRKAIPLMMCGAGLAIAFRGLFWNIGAEGQIIAGAVAATWVALSLEQAPSWVLLPSMFGLGFLFGAAWCIIPALLRAKLKVNEVITTLMLNYVVISLATFLVDGPWKGSSQYGYPYTDTFVDSARIPFIQGTRIPFLTLILAPLFCVGLYLLLTRSRAGYEIKVTGYNPKAARYAGMSFTKTLFLIAVISGGLAGIAGVGEVAGVHGKLSYPEDISSGYGFTAIIVAWLARLNPLGVVVSSIFVSGLLVGGDAIRTGGVPAASIDIFMGLILLMLVSTEIFRSYEIKIGGGGAS